MDDKRKHHNDYNLNEGDAVIFWIEGRKHIGVFVGCRDGVTLVDGGAGVMLVMSEVKPVFEEDTP